MLAEMGVRVFVPEPLSGMDDVAPAPLERAVARVLAPVAPRAVAAAIVAPAPARLPAGDGVDGLGWEALEQVVGDWASALRRKPVFGEGDRQPDWLCVGDPPVEVELHRGAPFAGDEGKLLDNMLLAVGASRRRGAYLTNAFKCRLPDDREREAEEAARWSLVLQRQVELLRPKVILAMGRFAVQMLLQANEPPGRLRGRVHRYGDVPVVVTFHPKYLLHNLPDKGRAWADLCLAQAVLREGA
jgi:DNA polymerase